MIQLIRINPGILIGLVLLCGCALVCGFLGLLMMRSGASLRPIYWFAGFFAIVVLPQLAWHIRVGVNAVKESAGRNAALEQIAASADAEGRSDDVKQLFGPDADPRMITDARRISGDAFAAAELAQFAVLPNGDTVLLARFTGTLAAEKAWVDYLRLSGLNQLAGEGDSQRGYAVTRPTGDRAYALHLHNMVGIWTGADDAAIRGRMTAGGFKIPGRAPLADDGKGAASSGAASPYRIAVSVAGLTLYLLIVVLYFFKGAAWAGTYSPKPGGTPIHAAQLAARLEAINALDVPFQIERGTRPNEFFATWRYADAKWIDLARARGMRRTFRIRLTLDERHGVVRATDYTASFDGSVGRSGADVEWKSSVGIVFFQYEHHRVYGLQLDEQGRFKPELSYAYTFNVNEMKSSLIQAVTQAGWAWRPTIWHGPAWLRWLTE